MAMTERLLSAPLYRKENGFACDPRPHRLSLGFGIKVFEGNPIINHRDFLSTGVTPEILREKLNVWRPEETLEAAEILGEKGSVIIKGAPQSGKGSLLFGISSICDLMSWGYVFIDGHRQDASPEFTLSAIDLAKSQGKAVFYDSFDYLFAGNNLRKLSKEKNQERASLVAASLQRFRSPLVLTMHDGYWSKRFLDQQMLAQFAEFFEAVPEYHLSMTLSSEVSARKFLHDHGFSQNETETLFGLPKNGDLFDFLINNTPDGKRTLAEFGQALLNYSVLKDLARIYDQEIKELLEAFQKGQIQATKPLVNLVLSLDKKATFLPVLRKTR